MKLRSRQRGDEVQQGEAATPTCTLSVPKPQLGRKARNSVAQHSFLKRLKDRPEQYEQFRMHETIRLLEHRRNRTEAQKARDRETARLRMQRLRRKRNDAGLAVNPAPVKKTRSEVTEQRKQWRDRQRQYRTSISTQGKRRINEKRRQQYQAAKRQKTTQPPTGTPPCFQTNISKRKALSRTWSVAPKCPNKFAEVLSGMIDKSTPRKRAALKRKGIFSPLRKRQRRLDFLESTSVKSVLEEIRNSRSKRDVELRRLLYRSICIKNKVKKNDARNKLRLSWAFLCKPKHMYATMHRKKRKDALSQDTVRNVLNYFERTAREMPNARMVSKNKPSKVMECTMKTAFSEFKEEYPNDTLSFSKFSSLRPKHIKTVSNTKLMQCLCEYCINIDFKIESLYRMSVQVGNGNAGIMHKYQASNATLCTTEDLFPRKVCIDRKCEDCGVDNLRQQLQPFIDEYGHSQVKWKRWQNETYTKTTKGGMESQAKHFVLKQNVGTVTELVEELLTELEPFSKHLANAKWQGKQFDNLKSAIPKGWVLICMDFGQNYNCHYQDEAQSAHWSYQQATIHPIVAYYQCPQCCQPMHESCIFISNDHKHDYHAVQHFIAATNRHLVDRGLNIDLQIQFSDGSPTQYKSKIPFSDASHGFEDFGWKVQKHFFGTRHGKGPCDGEIGVVKKCALTAVRSRRVVISNAHDLFQFCKTNLSQANEDVHVHTKRTFFFVTDSEINRDRGARTDGIKPITNTRANHSFIGVEPFVVATKERSCFCDVCSTTTGQLCPNAEFTGHMCLVQLKRGISLPTLPGQVQSMDIDEAATSVTSPVQDHPTQSDESGTSPSTQSDESVAAPSTVQVRIAQGKDEAKPASQFTNGLYVAIKFTDKNCIYLALVNNIIGDALEVNFLKRRQSGTFEFTKEKHCHPKSDVCGIFSHPTMVQEQRAFVYKFASKELTSIREKNPVATLM